MTELLQQAFLDVERLPADQQDAIAAMVREELEEREWDALVSSPASQELLVRLAAEARRADDAGETEESDDTW